MRHSPINPHAVWVSVLCGVLFSSNPVMGDDRATISEIKKLGGTVRATNLGLDICFQFRGRSLTDAGLAHVAKLSNVVSLDLRKTRVTSRGLVHLAKLKKLRWLRLDETTVDDAGMKHLVGLKSLESLNLFGTQVTDAGIKQLAGLKKLKRLYVWKTKVTTDGAAQLKASLPRLKVSHGVDLAKLPKYTEAEEDLPEPKVNLTLVAVSDKSEAPKSGQGLNSEVVFENKSGMPVKLYWVSFGGPLKLYAELKPGQVRRQNSYSKHTWLITDTSENPIGYFVADVEVGRAVIPK